MNNWPKCPKCRSRNVELIEVWDATISWLPDDPYFNDGALMPGDPKWVEGNCLDCEHKWRLRNATQVKPEWFENGGGDE